MSLFSQLKANAGILAGGGSVVTAAAVAVAVLAPAPGPEIGTAPEQAPPPVPVAARRTDDGAAGNGQIAAAPRPEAGEAGETAGEKLAEGEKVAEGDEARARAEAGPPAVAIESAALADIATGAETAAPRLGGGAGERVVASLPGATIAPETAPATRPALNTAPAGKPRIAAPVENPAAAPRLVFDLVRVDRYGSAVVAGKAGPGQRVEVMIDGAPIAEVAADGRGRFVALFDLPPSENPQVITLALLAGGGERVPSRESVVVMGREVLRPAPVAGDGAPGLPEEEAPPAVILADDQGARVIQPAEIASEAPEVMANVTLDLISYDDQGEVVLSGRGGIRKHVRIYVNDKPIRTRPVDEAGNWQVSIPEVAPGVYTLRVDEIDDAGKVTSRIETPIKKEDPQQVMRSASLQAPSADAPAAAPPRPRIKRVTIQKGATLWALARSNYGQGRLYVQIFHANRDSIRDPDLIYPGQIFTIP